MTLGHLGHTQHTRARILAGGFVVIITRFFTCVARQCLDHEGFAVGRRDCRRWSCRRRRRRRHYCCRCPRYHRWAERSNGARTHEVRIVFCGAAAASHASEYRGGRAVFGRSPVGRIGWEAEQNPLIDHCPGFFHRRKEPVILAAADKVPRPSRSAATAPRCDGRGVFKALPHCLRRTSVDGLAPTSHRTRSEDAFLLVAPGHVVREICARRFEVTTPPHARARIEEDHSAARPCVTDLALATARAGRRQRRVLGTRTRL